MAALSPGVSFDSGDIQPHGLGALDEREEGSEGGNPPSFTPLPPSVDLRSGFGPVRNQGQRGTCVAHAGTAVREYLLGQQPPALEFSEQYHYWDCKQHDMIPNLGGTYIRTSMARLQENGIALESNWPYNPTPIPGNEGQGPAPQAPWTRPVQIASILPPVSPPRTSRLCQTLAKRNQFPSPCRFTTTGSPSRSIPAAISACRCPASRWLADMPCAWSVTRRYETTPGGGYFMVRNSWGESWGRAGYARIPFAYIIQYGSSAYIAAVGTRPRALATFAGLDPELVWMTIRWDGTGGLHVK